MTDRGPLLRVLLTLLAAINLLIAIWVIAHDPRRSSDLQTIYEWCRQWLHGHVDLYALPDAATDYPPNAIVLYSPLALLPSSWLVPVWTAANLALAVLLPIAAVQAAGDRRLRAPLIVACFLCWSAVRTLLQFSALSLTLSMVALYLSDRRPFMSGTLLGLALAKPHIAGPVALWALVTRRWPVIVTAVSIVVAGTAIYCLWTGAAPALTMQRYWSVLATTYGGRDGLTGVTSIRAWVNSDAVWLVLSAMLLLVASAMAAVSRRASGLDRLTLVASLCLCSLASVYHNGNNLILALPAFLVLWLRAPLAVVVIVQMLLMLDVPARVPRPPFVDANRVLVVAMLGYLIALWWRARTRADIMSS